MFSCEFCEIFKNNFFTEHLQVTTSVLDKICFKNLIKIQIIFLEHRQNPRRKVWHVNVWEKLQEMHSLQKNIIYKNIYI